MIEARFAKKGEIIPQKEIWKLCFKDTDDYIDFYYTNRYRDNESVVLLCDGVIAAMLAMIPARLVTPDSRSFNSAILYGIATHPQYQNRGFAAQIIDFSSKYLRVNDIEFSILVPAGKLLFDFYQKKDYQNAFYIREAVLTRETIETLPISADQHCVISSATPEQYNLRRNEYLAGRFYIAYTEEEIAYQKKLSQLAQTDIYNIFTGGISGCATVERVSLHKVLIKELLLSDAHIHIFLKQMARMLPAEEYTLRTPACFGEQLGGVVRPFGMAKKLQKTDNRFAPEGIRLTPEDAGYLGIAFD